MKKYPLALGSAKNLKRQRGISLRKTFFASPLNRCRKPCFYSLLLCFFLLCSPFLFSSSLSDFDRRSEWSFLFDKDRFLAHLIDSGSPASSPLNRAWLENEIAACLRDPRFITALRQSLLQGDADLQETMFDSLLSLNLPANYAQSHLLQWILGSNNPVQSHLLQFPHSAAIRSRFATYLLHHSHRSDLWAQQIQKTCDSQDPDYERALRKAIPQTGQIDWTPLSRYPQLPSTAQLEFRWRLYRAIPKTECFNSSSDFERNDRSTFAELLWTHLLNKIDQTPNLRNEYLKLISQRTEPEQWTREALTEALRQNESDPWFQSYLQAAQIPRSRYQAVFLALTQNRAEIKIRPELIAESSQERTPWRERLIQLIQNDPRWSSYFLWHLTRASEPITLQLRRSLPSLFAQQESLTLEWYRWNNPSPKTLTSAQLKSWGIRWGETLLDHDREWQKLWNPHDLPTQSLLQKTMIAALESNPSLVIGWVTILQSHQPPLKNSFALWTKQNTPHPDMIHLPQFLNRLTASIERKEWVGNLDLALFRVALSNFLLSSEGWNQIRWRIGLESFQIAQPLRELLLKGWIKNREKFWKLQSWKTVYAPNPQAEQKLLTWIRTQKISEKSLLALSKQNRAIQTASYCLWNDLFQSNPLFQRALKSKSAGPTQQDDLDQLLNSIYSQNPLSEKTSLETILLRGGDSPLADWILRQSELQKVWITHFESKLTRDPLFLKRITESLLNEKQIREDSFSELVQILVEDRLFFENLLSDPTLGFKTKNTQTL